MFQFWKIFLVGFIVVLFLSLAAIGMGSLLENSYVKDYNRHLTQEVYQEAVENKNANLVFYKRTCPYCKAAKRSVVEAAETSSYPTFYIDLDTSEGQELREKYGIKEAPTILKMRQGQTELFVYSEKNYAGKIVVRENILQAIFKD